MSCLSASVALLEEGVMNSLKFALVALVFAMAFLSLADSAAAIWPYDYGYGYGYASVPFSGYSPSPYLPPYGVVLRPPYYGYTSYGYTLRYYSYPSYPYYYNYSVPRYYRWR